MQGRFLGNSGELNPEIWDAANVRFCLKAHLLDYSKAQIIITAYETAPSSHFLIKFRTFRSPTSVSISVIGA